MAVLPFKILHRATGGLPADAWDREFNQLVNSFFNGWESRSVAGRSFTPHLDVEEDEKKFVVTAELPGMEEKDIHVELADNILALRGEKKIERNEENKEKKFTRIERFSGSFYREVPLPVEVDESKVSADFKNGVLTIQLPKSAPATKEAKRIQINKS